MNVKLDSLGIKSQNPLVYIEGRAHMLHPLLLLLVREMKIIRPSCLQFTAVQIKFFPLRSNIFFTLPLLSISVSFRRHVLSFPSSNPVFTAAASTDRLRFLTKVYYVARNFSKNCCRSSAGKHIRGCLMMNRVARTTPALDATKINV